MYSYNYDVYHVSKGTVIEVANEVVGWREGNERNRKCMVDTLIKDAVEQKKRA